MLAAHLKYSVVFQQVVKMYPIENSSGNGTSSSMGSIRYSIEDNIIYKIFQVSLLVLFVSLSLIGNSFSIIVIRKATDIRMTTKIPMFSLAICCICLNFTFGIPMVGSTALGKWPYGRILCYGFSYVTMVLSGCNQCILLVINLDRFIAVIRPLHYDTIMSVWKIILMVALAFIYPLLLATLNATLPYQRVFYKPEYRFCYFDPYNEDVIDVIGICAVFTAVVIPIIITVLMYYKIYRVAKIHMQHIVAMRGTRSQEQIKDDRRRHDDNKAAKAFIMVTVGFVLSWLPFIVAIGYEYVMKKEPAILPWWSELCIK